MGRPKNATISRRNNISRTSTHKHHGAVDNCAPEEAKESEKVSKKVEEDVTWVDDDDELINDAQQEVRSISSHSSSIAVLDGMEENDIYPSDSLHFNMMLSTGIASWY
jgi:hypothetical protein